MRCRIYLYTIHEVRSLFSEILKELREDHDHTQADLADLLGVAKSTVSNWEQNKSEPNFDLLCKICDVYSVSADYLLGRRNDDIQQKRSRFEILSEENRLFVRKLELFLINEQQKEAKK